MLDYTEVVSWAQVTSRQLLNGEGMISFAAWVDGLSPNARSPLREIDLKEALTSWLDVAKSL